jgi:hypothetical protein
VQAQAKAQPCAAPPRGDFESARIQPEYIGHTQHPPVLQLCPRRHSLRNPVGKATQDACALGCLGALTTWHDRQIGPGKEWEACISEHLASADVILPMVSPHFVASDYCWDKEVATAMTRHSLSQAAVVPIVLRETAFLDETPFGKLQMLPHDAKPVAEWRSADKVWKQVAEALEAVCVEWRNRAVVAEDAGQARAIYQQIVADAATQRAERERIMESMQRLIFQSATSPAPSASAFQPSANKAFSAMEAYIRSDSEPIGEAAPPKPKPLQD